MKRSFRLGLIAPHAPWRFFLILLILGFGLRIGYGVVRYRSGLITISGRAFITAWNFDALEHVLIAKALLSGKGYIVDDSPVLDGKHVHHAGEDALFKAPLYQFFLAGLFAISGFSFILLFPLQALFGGLLTGLVGLLTLETFRRPRAAWLAGFGAAAPVLPGQNPAPKARQSRRAGSLRIVTLLGGVDEPEQDNRVCRPGPQPRPLPNASSRFKRKRPFGRSVVHLECGSLLPLSSSRLAGVGVGQHRVRHTPPAAVRRRRAACRKAVASHRTPSDRGVA